jgi:septal ring factor EnvC (AmiA/AmiB activator)
MLGLKGMAMMGVLMLAMAGAFAWYYKDSQSRIATLTENNAKLEIAVQTNEETINVLQQDFAKANAEITRINREFQAIREQNRELSNRLAKHDLGVLGNEKPALVERIINGASNKVGRCFELLSGAELTEEERNAKDARSFNSECPWLYDDLIRR